MLDTLSTRPHRRPPVPRRCRAVPAPRLNAPDTWHDVLKALRHDLLVVQIGSARLAAGDELSEDDLDDLGLAAIHCYEVLEALA